MNNRIIVFGGTTEGRMISERLSVEKIYHTVCVATAYGEMLLSESNFAAVNDGRMDEEEIKDFIKDAEYVIDATHPYATAVTNNIKKAVETSQAKLIRIIRDKDEENKIEEVEKDENVIFFSSMSSLSDYLSEYSDELLDKKTGNILLTTGSKELSLISEKIDRQRLFVRVLPSIESIELCEKYSIPNNHIIAMHGPFSTEINRALIRQYDIKILVTKQSGKRGGYQEKLDAAKAEGCKVFVIKRPEENEGFTIEEAVKMITNSEIREKGEEPWQLQVALIGVGMGQNEGLTLEALQAIKKSQAVFGAKRLLSFASGKINYPLYSAKDIIPVAIKEGYKKICVLFSGDTGFFSGAKSFNDFVNSSEIYQNININIIPGISSLSYLSAKIGIPYGNANIISLHGKNNTDNITAAARSILNNRNSFLIFSSGDDLKALALEVSRWILDDEDSKEIISAYVGRNLSYEDESISHLSLKELTGLPKEGLYAACFVNEIRKNIIVAKNEKAIKGEVDRVVIAAAGSGSGKTMISCALLNILKEDKKNVIAYKCGPDYIDPMFHRNVLGIAGGNLDSCFCDGSMIRRVIATSGYDTALIEGVMGIYDGIGGMKLQGSCYDIAVKSGTPILLIVDAKGQGSTVMSTIKGIINDDYYGMIKGIILNRISERFYNKLLPLLEKEIRILGRNISVIGFVPTLSNIEIKSRHLGLLMPDELDDLHEKIDILSANVKEHCNIDKLYEIMQQGTDIYEDSNNIDNPYEHIAKENSELGLRLAVAADEAFCFYYEENLSLFREMGVDIVKFSPCHDDKLPDNIDGLLLGGGYPENHLEVLANNNAMKKSIKEAIENGLPTLAECGGFMYLHDIISDKEDNDFEMCGVIRGKCYYSKGLKRFGYVEIREETGESAFNSLCGMRGHEFHYYESTNNGNNLLLGKVGEDIRYESMHTKDNCLFGFMHMYYRSKPEFIVEFVERMKNVRG